MAVGEMNSRALNLLRGVERRVSEPAHEITKILHPSRRFSKR